MALLAGRNALGAETRAIKVDGRFDACARRRFFFIGRV